MKRKAAVAGGFYPRFKEELIEIIEECFVSAKFGPGSKLNIGNEQKPRKILGGICPHAGYVYSGPVAANTFQKLVSDGIPDTFIILGTTHTGYRQIALMSKGEWETPIGDVAIDEALAQSILNESDKKIIDDESAFSGFPHGREHNIEVQVPFIKYISLQGKKDVKIVPIVIGSTAFKQLRDIGESIARAIKKSNKDVVIIASSDMTHYEPKNCNEPQADIEEMRRRDDLVMNAIKSYDWKDTLEKALNTTVCGPQTITTLMIACKELGASKSEILKYYNSYDKLGGSGFCDYVVGYLSAVFSL